MSKQPKEKLKGELSDSEIEKLKAQYPGLKSIIFTNYDTLEKGVVYIKKIPRAVYETALQISEKKSRVTVGEYLLTNLRVGGMEAKEIIDDIYWLGEFAAHAETLIFIHNGEIKKN